uniref:Uncharacterized protein n=1 Tax=Chromera velia CCMP2878 TaxID=1169474 RepID=A0A0G4HN72_9ALVE|eukprot:Cvel_29389.t1-p1 / transcript=Cvel_29389.t1 / gene=Cvel_29389 / organism=Chromera_velia_CCMP2878 / gene_product=hypothetical protein / transcript_product=hypothetical protein / location=Cvel_scaffold4007:11365-11697(-) / protein_length=111 / sequence_SO=supercontig / SO=protein_coding / is_pseudo=false
MKEDWDRTIKRNPDLVEEVRRDGSTVIDPHKLLCKPCNKVLCMNGDYCYFKFLDHEKLKRREHCPKRRRSTKWKQSGDGSGEALLGGGNGGLESSGRGGPRQTTPTSQKRI